MRDIGRVELGAQTYGQIFKANDQPAAGIAIFQAPGANALECRRRSSTSAWRSWRASFPQGCVFEIPFDTTMFVDEAIKEVYKTLIEAGVLVLIVILIFLQDWRAMLIPATTVPVTIIGAFAAMAALGFTVNLLDAVRDRAGDRHRGRRRDRHRRGRRAQHRARPDAARRLDQGDGRTVRADHRHHAGADVGVHSGGVHAGPDRQDVRAVRAGDRRDRAAQRDQRRDAEADAGALWLRAPVPPEKRNVVYRGFNRGYDAARARLRRG